MVLFYTSIGISSIASCSNYKEQFNGVLSSCEKDNKISF